MIVNIFQQQMKAYDELIKLYNKGIDYLTTILEIWSKCSNLNSLKENMIVFSKMK